MNLKTNILNALGIYTKRDVSAISAKAAERAWKAGQYSRYRANAAYRKNEINADIKLQNEQLIARAWELRQNNPVVAGMALTNRMFVIGPEGFDFIPMAKYPDGKLDNVANNIIKNKFDEWNDEKYCTVSERMSWWTVQNLVLDQLFFDGMFVIRKLVSGSAIKDNPFGFTLQFLDAYDIDHQYSIDYGNGNAVLNGVEVDEWRRIKGLWFRKKKIYDEQNGSGYTVSGERYFISSKELYIGFDPIHPKQLKGVTPLAPVINVLYDLDMWQDYSLQNAKYSASKMMFLQYAQDSIEQYSETPDGNEINAEGESEEQTADYGKYMDIEGGSIEELPRGATIANFDPKFPHEQHAPFVRSNLRTVATGTGFDYGQLSGDRENESYSSGRNGELKERGRAFYLQSLLRHQFLNRVAKDWVKYALLNDQLTPLSFSLLSKYQKFYFQGYVKPWVDGYKEALTNKINQEIGAKSKIQTVGENGNRMEDIIDDTVLLREMLKAKGLPEDFFDSVKTTVNNDAANNSNNADRSIQEPTLWGYGT